MGDVQFGNFSPLTKLKIAYQLLAAVADMYSFAFDQVPSLFNPKRHSSGCYTCIVSGPKSYELLYFLYKCCSVELGIVASA
jgi:hypothetical protein